MATTLDGQPQSHLSDDAESVAVGAAGVLDAAIALGTFGLAQPDLAARVWSWWEGATPEQEQAAIESEDQGAIGEAAAKTYDDLRGIPKKILEDVVPVGVVALLVLGVAWLALRRI